MRYLTNHSTGKMGYAIARMAMLRGAEVTLISGPTALEPPPFVTVVPVISAEDMFQAVSRTCPTLSLRPPPWRTTPRPSTAGTR